MLVRATLQPRGSSEKIFSFDPPPSPFVLHLLVTLGCNSTLLAVARSVKRVPDGALGLCRLARAFCDLRLAAVGRGTGGCHDPAVEGRGCHRMDDSR